jgi:hypothetical protein
MCFESWEQTEMKKIKCLMVAWTVVVCMGGGISKADADEKVTVGGSADFYEKYVWRGQDLVDDWVFQPGASVGYGGLTASFWGNLELTDENGHNGEMSEVDLTLDYSGQVPGIDILGYSVGMIYYDFPVNGAADDTEEVYAGLSLDVPASPSVTVYYDVDEVKDGTYISFGVSHSFENVFEIGPDTPVGVDLSASIGWANSKYNKIYWGTKPNGTSIGSAANDLVLSLALPFELAGFDVTASLNYVTLVDKDIRRTDAYGKGRDDMLFAGIGIAKEF